LTRPASCPLLYRVTRIGPLALAFVVAGSVPSGRDPAVFPIGTTLPIRFLQAITSGQDSVGTQVRVQTMGALVSDGCVTVPPFTQAAGTLTLSRRGRIFGGRGALGLRFDSLQIGPGRWLAVNALLDTLEYTPDKDLSNSGVAYGRRGSIAKRVVPFGIAGAADVAVMPVAILGGYWLARRGPAAKIVAGEVGRLRLTTPLSIAADSGCVSVAASRPLVAVPVLPEFMPRSETKGGRFLGDPMNLIFLGTLDDLDSAFLRAGWVGPKPTSFRTVSREIVAGLANRQSIGAPLSTQYFRGRPQDLAYQLAGPNARYRHHARIWQLDTLATVWVGAATEDAGMKVNPFKGRFTHAIRPAIDGERDRVVRELEATGCADLVDYVAMPGAQRHGRNYTGQRFVTDGRTAIITVRPCNRPSGT
jgi:LssY-like putative type I secretion system component LssY